MSKIKRIPATIFDDHVAKKIKSSLESYLVEMWKLVYAHNQFDSKENNEKDKNRSSTKTDDLHNKFADVIVDCFGNYKGDFLRHFGFRIETDSEGNATKRLKSDQKDLYGKNFNIDMELIDKSTRNVLTTVLLKAPMTSICKNRFNAIDNMLGEALRVLTKENLESQDNALLFVTFVPNETFTVNKKHNNIKTEYSNHIALYSSANGTSTILDESAMSDRAKEKISEIVIAYDFTFKDKEFNTLQDLKDEVSQNSDFIAIDDSTIQYLRYYTYRFLEKNQDIPEFSELLEYVMEKNLHVPQPIMLIDDPAKKPVKRIGKSI